MSKNAARLRTDERRDTRRMNMVLHRMSIASLQAQPRDDATMCYAAFSIVFLPDGAVNGGKTFRKAVSMSSNSCGLVTHLRSKTPAGEAGKTLSTCRQRPPVACKRSRRASSTATGPRFPVQMLAGRIGGDVVGARRRSVALQRSGWPVCPTEQNPASGNCPAGAGASPPKGTRIPRAVREGHCTHNRRLSCEPRGQGIQCLGNIRTCFLYPAGSMVVPGHDSILVPGTIPSPAARSGPC
jgi:hypothetical protein